MHDDRPQHEPLGSDIVGMSSLDDGVSEPDRVEALVEADKAQLATKPLGLWADTWRRLRRNKIAVVGLVIISVFLAVGLFEVAADLFGFPATARRRRPAIPWAPTTSAATSSPASWSPRASRS
jgi:hypothetical protein